MKRILAAALTAVSLSAFAAWERVGTLQLADMPSQGEAVGKLGAFIGNPLATASMAAVIGDLPTLKFFGPMRPKATMVLALYVDGEKLAADSAEALGGLELALLYPVAATKDEFLARHPGAAETNGVVAVKGGFSQKGETVFVAFSKDGRWAGASDKAERAKLALAEVDVAERPMDGDIVRLRIDERGFRAVAAALKSVASGGAFASDIALVESYRSLSAGLRVSDAGVDLRGALRFAEGSEAARCGQKPLGANPLAFAGKSFAASAQAEDCGNSQQVASTMWDEIVASLKRGGLDVTTFFVREKAPWGDRFSIDLAAAVAFFEGGADKALKGFKAEKFLEDVKALKTEPFAAKAPPYAQTLDIKGFASEWTAAERFAATLPEASGKRPFAVSFMSVSSIVKASVAQALKLVPEERREALKPFADQVAVESKCGIASMCWMQNGAQRFFLRVSADEFRCLGGFFSAAMMFGLGGNAPAAPAATDDNED